MAVYLATGLHRGKAQPEEDEVIYKRLLPLPVALRMAVGGTIRDAKTIASVLWFEHQLAQQRTGLGLRLRSASQSKKQPRGRK
jgi:hypothetical protein